jgi:diguanylate cyclase (GGDEF)-like protein
MILNALSLLSFSSFVIFFLLGLYCLKLNKTSRLNQMACIECLLLSEWAFAYTFFYTASTVNQAMFWHRVGWIGGSLFPPFAILFFILLSQRKQYISHVWQYAVIFLLPVILLIKNIFGKSTSLASGFVQSGAGWGWTYVNSVENVWTWIYLLALGLYFSFGFYLLLQWRKESPYQTQKRQAMVIIISFHDITARMEIQQELLKSRENYKRLADELYQLANYDTLTHLPNRRLFHQQLAAYASHYGAIKDDFAVIFLDLNHFKKINDQYGHVVGDQVLIETAKRLESVRLQNEILSRMGGDEFTLIIPALQSETTLSQRINALKAAFSAPFLINNLSLKLSISAGAARYSQADQHLNILLKCADEQMYQDKRTKNCDHFSQKLE